MLRGRLRACARDRDARPTDRNAGPENPPRARDAFGPSLNLAAGGDDHGAAGIDVGSCPAEHAQPAHALRPGSFDQDRQRSPLRDYDRSLERLRNLLAELLDWPSALRGLRGAASPIKSTAERPDHALLARCRVLINPVRALRHPHHHVASRARGRRLEEQPVARLRKEVHGPRNVLAPVTQLPAKLLDHDLGLNVAFERLVYGDRSGRKDVGMRGIPAALLADHVAPYDG